MAADGPQSQDHVVAKKRVVDDMYKYKKELAEV